MELQERKEDRLRKEVIQRAGDIAKVLARGSDVELRKTRDGLKVCAVAKQIVS